MFAVHAFFRVIYEDYEAKTMSGFHVVVEMHCMPLLYFPNHSTKVVHVVCEHTTRIVLLGTVLTGATYFLHFIFKTAWRFLTPVSVLKSASYQAGTNSISTSREKSRILSDKVKRSMSKIYSNVLVQLARCFLRRILCWKMYFKT